MKRNDPPDYIRDKFRDELIQSDDEHDFRGYP